MKKDGWEVVMIVAGIVTIIASWLWVNWVLG
jgi:hypothetical protein